MAGEVLSDIASALSQTFQTGFARQYARTTETLKNIRVIRGGGKNCAWDVEFSGAVARSHVEGADVDAAEFSIDKLVPATLDWANYHQVFQVSENDVAAAATSIGIPGELERRFEEAMTGAFTKLAALINHDIHQGTGAGTDINGNPTKTIVGLFGGALDASGTYAGIARGTYAEWDGNVLGNSGIPIGLTVNRLDQEEQQIYTASRMMPNLLVATPAGRRKYKGLFEQSRRIVTDGSAPIRYSTGTSVFDYNTAPVLRDVDCPSGKIAVLNTEWIELVQLPAPDMIPLIAKLDKQLMSSNGAQMEPLPLVCKVEALPKAGDAYKFRVNVKCQLRVRRPNASGYLADIDET